MLLLLLLLLLLGFLLKAICMHPGATKATPPPPTPDPGLPSTLCTRACASLVLSTPVGVCSYILSALHGVGSVLSALHPLFAEAVPGHVVPTLPDPGPDPG